LNRRGRRVAFCSKGTKDRRAKSQVEEIGQGGDGLSGLRYRQCIRANAMRGLGDDPRDRAIQMSAGDKDRSASTASVVRSRRPGHVTQPKSTNTARLICWRNCRDQVPAALSATGGRAAASRSGNVLENNGGS
jgi:hypothetical protein